MKRIPALFLIFLLSYSSYGQMNRVKEAATLIELTGKKYAPDNRVVLWSVEAKQAAGKLLLSGETTSAEAASELRAALRERRIAVVDQLQVLPGQEFARHPFGIVNLSVINIRKVAEHSAEMVTQALLGTVVKVFKKEKGWYYIQTPDGYLGYTDDDGIAIRTKSEIADYLHSPRMIVTTLHSSLLSEKDVDAAPLSDLVAGNILVCNSTEDSWHKVMLPDGRTGFVRASDCVEWRNWMNTRNPSPDNLVKNAKQFLGIPYLWGGTSSKGVDCSGFTKSVYYLNGVQLARDASQQVHQGTLVDTIVNISVFQPGDLLFFGRKSAERGEHASHVGIYIGDGRYIHSSGMVRINSLEKSAEDFNEYRYRSFLRAKRIIPLTPDSELLLINNPLYHISEAEK
jgi:hypothetical protein